MKTFLAAAAAFLQIVNISATPLNRRDNYLCASVGYQAGTDSFITTRNGGCSACSALCFSQSDCKSFAWSSTECNLYNVPVAGNYQFEGDSPYYFYDRECETAYSTCGTAGYQHTFDSYCWSNNTSLTDCASNCKNDAGCKSYAFGNGECLLYAEPAYGNFEGTDSPYLFYDATCPAPSSSATSTTTVKSSTKSSTSIASSTSKVTSTSTRTTAITSSTTGKISSSTPATTTTTPVKSTTKSSSVVNSSTSKTSTGITKTTASTSLTTTSKASSTTKTTSTTSKSTTSTTKLTNTSTKSSPTSQTPSSTARCGLSGVGNSTYNFLTDTTAGDSYSHCYATCNSHSDCKSFSFAPYTNYCILYNRTLSIVMTNIPLKGWNPYLYYDVACSTEKKLCDVAGWDKSSAYWDAWQGYTADSCAAACVADTACMSFSSGNGECHLYKAPVFVNINAQTASPYEFSDVTCVGGNQ